MVIQFNLLSKHSSLAGLLKISLLTLVLGACGLKTMPEQVKKDGGTEIVFATFNVSMEATNYLGRETESASSEVLAERLATGTDPQIRNIAEIIQRSKADVILLNEFDYIADPARGIQAFVKNYLNVNQQGAGAVDFPFVYLNTSNTGQPTPFDLDKDGVASGVKGDAYGFGYFPGHYGMVLLSRYPIDFKNVRTFQYFLWSDMPGALRPGTETDGFWHSDEAWLDLRLSSKSHWDIPVIFGDTSVHILASHPTPPVFDGPEDRNGKRNHDELRFWRDYILGKDYIYDDNKLAGGLAKGARFVILGDLNASALEGGANRQGIGSLLALPEVNSLLAPSSLGGSENKPENPLALNHTAHWGMRADYVLPSSAGISVLSQGVFWPKISDNLYRLVENRSASSDHRLVWLNAQLKP